MQTQKSHSDDDDDGGDDGDDDDDDGDDWYKMEIFEMALMPMAMMMRKALFYLSLYSPSWRSKVDPPYSETHLLHFKSNSQELSISPVFVFYLRRLSSIVSPKEYCLKIIQHICSIPWLLW